MPKLYKVRLYNFILNKKLILIFDLIEIIINKYLNLIFKGSKT